MQAYRGQTVSIQCELSATREADITWQSLELRGAVANPPSGKLPVPDLYVTRLEPVSAAAQSERNSPQRDRLPTRPTSPITFLGQTYSGGYGMARNSSIAFAIEPEYKTFVALAGTSANTAGPLRIRIDGQSVWESPVLPATAGAQWIEVAIPEGAKQLTLECGTGGDSDGYAAFANAGFRKR
jgi:hypothetical protein